MDPSVQHPRGPSYPELLRADTYDVPEPIRTRSDGDLEPRGVDRARYLSPEFHALEVERRWKRVLGEYLGV